MIVLTTGASKTDPGSRGGAKTIRLGTGLLLMTTHYRDSMYDENKSSSDCNTLVTRLKLTNRQAAFSASRTYGISFPRSLPIFLCCGTRGALAFWLCVVAVVVVGRMGALA